MFFVFCLCMWVSIQFPQHYLLKRLSFPTLKCLGTFVKNLFNHICEISLLCSPYSIVLYVCLYASTIYYGEYCMYFVVHFEIMKCETCNFVLFQGCFDILDYWIVLVLWFGLQERFNGGYLICWRIFVWSHTKDPLPISHNTLALEVSVPFVYFEGGWEGGNSCDLNCVCYAARRASGHWCVCVCVGVCVCVWENPSFP